MLKFNSSPWIYNVSEIEKGLGESTVEVIINVRCPKAFSSFMFCEDKPQFGVT